jgi:hypothetical protein
VAKASLRLVSALSGCREAKSNASGLKRWTSAQKASPSRQLAWKSSIATPAPTNPRDQPRSDPPIAEQAANHDDDDWVAVPA